MRRLRARCGFVAVLSLVAAGCGPRAARLARPTPAAALAAPPPDPAIVGMPAGAGKAATVRLCSDCHGLARVVETRQSLAQWRDTLDEMQDNGLEASPRELAAVRGYLAKYYGATGRP